MDPIYFILQKLRKRPGLYLGETSLTALGHFLNGYTFRLAIEIWMKKTGLDVTINYDLFIRSPNAYDADTDRFSFLSDFDSFIHNYYQDNTTNDWVKIISENSSSQIEAFDKFYELFDSYMDKKEK